MSRKRSCIFLYGYFKRFFDIFFWLTVTVSNFLRLRLIHIHWLVVFDFVTDFPWPCAAAVLRRLYNTRLFLFASGWICKPLYGTSSITLYLIDDLRLGWCIRLFLSISLAIPFLHRNMREIRRCCSRIYFQCDQSLWMKLSFQGCYL